MANELDDLVEAAGSAAAVEHARCLKQALAHFATPTATQTTTHLLSSGLGPSPASC